jgi:hypothetical protein
MDLTIVKINFDTGRKYRSGYFEFRFGSRNTLRKKMNHLIVDRMDGEKLGEISGGLGKPLTPTQTHHRGRL